MLCEQTICVSELAVCDSAVVIFDSNQHLLLLDPGLLLEVG